MGRRADASKLSDEFLSLLFSSCVPYLERDGSRRAIGSPLATSSSKTTPQTPRRAPAALAQKTQPTPSHTTAVVSAASAYSKPNESRARAAMAQMFVQPLKGPALPPPPASIPLLAAAMAQPMRRRGSRGNANPVTVSAEAAPRAVYQGAAAALTTAHSGAPLLSTTTQPSPTHRFGGSLAAHRLHGVRSHAT